MTSITTSPTPINQSLGTAVTIAGTVTGLGGFVSGVAFGGIAEEVSQGEKRAKAAGQAVTQALEGARPPRPAKFYGAIAAASFAATALGAAIAWLGVTIAKQPA